ncbi:hypothetical protein K402DRAFT_166988 [Aulographum hederae CBS 113979]|uniref:Fork-head domain-containing protein n=1 Tax=Aulographum hederae CBS 113979 TaxID=1176131 RepID=A0A6G1GRL8_9PEZI|nr:hypothetical protein K402DRAFT_166988 [Aulographum hederae CBS 113979]
MAGARRAPPLKIFQDPVRSFDHSEIAEAEAALYSALGPNSTRPTNSGIAMDQPYTDPRGFSPSKTRHYSPPRALSEASLNLNTHHAFMQPHPQYHNPMPDQSGFNHFTPYGPFDKENDLPSAIYDESPSHISHFSDPSFAFKPNNKRPLMDAAPLRERATKSTKLRHEDDVTVNLPLPLPSEMPPVEDEPDGSKPQISYATLIGMAILRSENRRLTLAQIYKWISTTFKYYNRNSSGWQNSIRHNLSLSKAFKKVERPKDDPGKGNYWVIEPGAERQFLKDKPGHRQHAPSKNPSFSHIPSSDVIRPSTAQSMAAFPSSQTASKNIDSSKFPEEGELSSDATIPATDPDCHDGVDVDKAMPPPMPRNIRSSPPVEIHSSPPAAVTQASQHEHGDTPPPAPRFPSTSRSGGRKCKFHARDSGYYSSIESSALRGNAQEASANRRGRGRAEEEIARIRSSSYDSPSKGVPSLAQSVGGQIPSSPPFRPESLKRDNLLTPNAPVFKKPAMPPLSISPNTNLRIHRDRVRQMLPSPEKNMPVLGGTEFWNSPMHYANMTPPSARNGNPYVDDLFSQAAPDFSLFNAGDSGSPERRPAKRPALGRASTTSGALADMTSSRRNDASTPRLEPSLLDIPPPLESPCKRSKGSSALTGGYDPPLGDLFGDMLNSDDSDEAGFDMLQGFQKIGAKVPANDGSSNIESSKGPRPALGRSRTVMF